MHLMQRTNTFIIECNDTLWELADKCSKFWNELNYDRRKACINNRIFEWYPKHLYNKYSVMIGSYSSTDNEEEE